MHSAASRHGGFLRRCRAAARGIWSSPEVRCFNPVNSSPSPLDVLAIYALYQQESGG